MFPPLDTSEFPAPDTTLDNHAEQESYLLLHLPATDVYLDCVAISKQQKIRKVIGRPCWKSTNAGHTHHVRLFELLPIV